MTPPGQRGGGGTRGRAAQARPLRSEGSEGSAGRPGGRPPMMGRTGGRPRREPGTETPLVATAQILLGLTVSCAFAMAAMGALIGLIVLIAYVVK